jgi:hypothetical protein
MNRIRVWLVLFVVAAGFALALFGLASASMAPLTIRLDAENNSGIRGTAVLTDLGGGLTKVEIAVTGEPAGGSEPVHIHSGQCGPTLGGVAYPLTPVVEGKSTTTINVALESLLTGNFAINGHESAANIGRYIFCGNLPSQAMMMAHETATESAMAAAHATATHVAAMAAETQTPAAPTTLPATGGTPTDNWLLPLLALALVALGTGLAIRRLAR